MRHLRLDPHDVRALKRVLDHYLRCGAMDNDPSSELREARIENIRAQLDGPIVRQPMRWEKAAKNEWHFFDGGRHAGTVKLVNGASGRSES